MRGLLRKDWYLIWKMAWAYVLMIVCFEIGALFRTDVNFIGVYPFILTGMLPMTLLTSDETNGFLSYLQATPVSRAAYVTERYLFHALCLGALLLLTASARLLLRTPGTGDLLSVGVTLGLLIPALILPFPLRFGVEKGRMVHLIVAGAVTAAVIVYGTTLQATALPQPPRWIPCAAALALYAASWRLSIRLYEKREL